MIAYICCLKAHIYVQSRLRNVSGVMYGFVLFIHLLTCICSYLDLSDLQRGGLIISAVEGHQENRVTAGYRVMIHWMLAPF